MPYLYTTAEEMSRTGIPIMRPLFLEFPNGSADGQPVDLNTGNAFLLGGDLLVAQSPYPDEMDDYTVALPAVGWYDYWTGARVDGNANRKAIDNNPVTQPEVHIHRTLDTLPVFVRAGAIVPEQPLVQSTEETPQGPLTLRVYPPAGTNKDCGGSLYLDDGVSYAFAKGDSLRVEFTCQRTVARPDGDHRTAPRQLRPLVEAGLHRGLRCGQTGCRGQRRSAGQRRIRRQSHLCRIRRGTPPHHGASARRRQGAGAAAGLLTPGRQG